MYTTAVATSEPFSQFSLCSLGFTVVLTASVVVMVCSMAGIPTSTTHCQVKIGLIFTILILTNTILNVIVLVISFIKDHEHCFHPFLIQLMLAGNPTSTTQWQVLVVITNFLVPIPIIILVIFFLVLVVTYVICR